MTNAEWEGYEPGGNIQTSSGSMFKNIISKLFPQTKGHGIEGALREQWVAN